MKFIVHSDVFDKLPNACFGIVIAKGIDNTVYYPQIDIMLDAAISSAEDRFKGKKVKEDPSILPYRSAFQKLGINPNKFMSSIEAMFTRVAKGKGLPHINPIVDLGNTLSLKYVLPMGAHDIIQAEGQDIEVRFSREGDTFVPFGESTPEPVSEGELIYTVGTKVRTRRWTWRQSELGKIGKGSRDIFFPIDGFSGVNEKEVLAARDELAALCGEIFGISGIKTGFVCRDNKEFKI